MAGKKAVTKKSNKKSPENENLCALLTYLIIGIIWHFADEKMKKNEFVKFHSKQAINLWLIFIIGDAVLSLVRILNIPFSTIFSVFILVVGIIAAINALNGRKEEVLIIGQFAEKYLTY